MLASKVFRFALWSYSRGPWSFLYLRPFRGTALPVHHRNPQPERFRQRLSFEKYRAQHAKQRHAPFPEL
jgi:hypothetical protein